MTICEHCSLPSDDMIIDSGKYFCCHGCLSVYGILKANSLEKFYQLKSSDKLVSLKDYRKSQFNYLDNEQFLSENIINLGESKVLRFYLENVSCVACLWLIEKLSDFVPGVISSRLNLSNSIVEIKVLNKENFKDACLFLDSLGYKPHIINSKQQAIEYAEKEVRALLNKVAVAGMIAGNIMLLAISVYAGAKGIWSSWFSVISGLLFLPILFYSAIPFYQNCLLDLKKKKISLDTLVTTALVLGAALSYYNVFIGTDLYYFDSLAVLVFLLLGSRFYLKKVQLKVLSYNAKPFKITSEEYLNTVGARVVLADEIEVQDHLLIKEGQTIPCEAKLLDGQIFVSRSFLTGESRPRKILMGESLYAGDIALSESTIEITKNFEKSDLGLILSQIEDKWLKNNNLLEISQKFISYLLKIVLASSLIILSYYAFTGNLLMGFNKVLALLIITCPCSLGLGIPLILTLGLKKLARRGVLIKDANIISILSTANNIFLDKTGTLTKGEYQVKSWQGIRDNETRNAVFQLESRSKHPIAKSLIKYLKADGNKYSVDDINNFQEVPGIGVEGFINNAKWSISKSTETKKGYSLIEVFRNDIKISLVSLRDNLFEGSKGFIQDLQKDHRNVFLLSGDNKENCELVADELGITQTFSECLPGDKENIVGSYQNTIMIGDGINDIKAMGQANISIAVKPDVDLAIDSADISILEKGVKSIGLLFDSAKDIKRTLNHIIILSLTYNGIGGVLAIGGFISPLVAAILMPISVLGITSYSLFRLNKMERTLWK